MVSRTTAGAVGRFALDARRDEDTATRPSELPGSVGKFDREAEPDEADTMGWGTDAALWNCEETPAAVVDAGAIGKEPMRRLLASDAATLLADVRVLCGENRVADEA